MSEGTGFPQEARAMESWDAYKDVTFANSIVMDQITQQAVLASARIGIEVAPGSLEKLDWGAAHTVRLGMPRCLKSRCDETRRRARRAAHGPSPPPSRTTRGLDRRV